MCVLTFFKLCIYFCLKKTPGTMAIGAVSNKFSVNRAVIRRHIELATVLGYHVKSIIISFLDIQEKPHSYVIGFICPSRLCLQNPKSIQMMS